LFVGGGGGGGGLVWRRAGYGAGDPLAGEMTKRRLVGFGNLRRDFNVKKGVKGTKKTGRGEEREEKTCDR